MTCDPCEHCTNLYDDSDPSVGLYGYGCTYFDNGGDDWTPEANRPCPGFTPVLSSETLLIQLSDEYEEEFYKGLE